MRKYSRISCFIYFFSGVLFVFSPVLGSDALTFILKALIVPSLLVFFLATKARPAYMEDKFIIAALIFSWLGDILLQFKHGGELFFLIGLLAFLMTHIFYTIVFFGAAGEFIFFKSKKPLILIIIVYGSLTIYTILPGLGNMQIPVTIYGLIITGMVIAALSRFGKVNDQSYLLVFLGALLFLISDSLIAFDKFKQAFPFSEVLIMGTYLAAQFMIILGIIKQEKKST